MQKRLNRIEYPTLVLILSSYASWLLLVLFGHYLPVIVWIPVFALNVTLFLSITHEVVHGHPTSSTFINRLLILFPIGWTFPYERFKDTHMQHHETDELTDPFDDPESWYYPKSSYESMNQLVRAVFTFNNTILGRMLIGPAISIIKFYISEIQHIIFNNNIRWYVLRVWGLHLVLCALLIAFISAYSTIPLWMYLAASYLGLSVLLIRTYLEHQARDDHAERTVIIEKCCPLAFLFLYNNLHAVHHEKPGIAWYELPDFYRKNRETFKNLNKHYIYASYGEIFKKYFLTPKEKIAHPFLRDAQ